jgi:hypothetical protein
MLFAGGRLNVKLLGGAQEMVDRWDYRIRAATSLFGRYYS